jgi:hypothetical protein
MVIGPKLKVRNFPNQKTEVRIGTNILNKMNGLGRAKYEAVAWPELWVRAISDFAMSMQHGSTCGLASNLCAPSASGPTIDMNEGAI